MRPKMRRHYITKDEFLKGSQSLPWHRSSHSCLLLVGKERSRRIEDLLRQSVAENLMKSAPDPQNPRRKVYAVRRITKGKVWNEQNHIIHDLGVTEGLVRLVISDRRVEIIPERWFSKHGYHIHPEFGLKYPNTILFYEFCTRDNALRLWNIRSKIERYQLLTGIILFVLDIERERVIELAEKLSPGGAFWFIDYATFKTAPLGEQLTFPFYINGGKGEILPLKSHV